MEIDALFKVLSKALKDKVFYGTNTYDNFDNASMPFIVYQEISKRPIGFMDNKPISYRSNIQITLVTKNKDLKLEKKLETTLLSEGLVFSLVSEFKNDDKSINRVYEISMEEI